MIKTSRSLQMARKWMQAAALGRRRISMAGRFWSTSQNIDHCSNIKRFVVPLKYLSSPIIMELFRMCEDEFGAERNTPLTFSFERLLMKYILSMIVRQLSQEMEKALLFFTTAVCNC